MTSVTPRRISPLIVTLLLGDAPGCGLFEEPSPHVDGDGLPSLDWEGERVVFGTDLLDDVCVGTIAALDASIESIEQELSLPPIDEKIPFYLLDDEAFVGRCPSGTPACFDQQIIYSSTLGMASKRHELTHARLLHMSIWGGRLWGEGIAAALDHSGGCSELAACATFDLDSLIEGEFGEVPSVAYTAGADLVHGLLMEHGPEAVLAFMASLSGEESPAEVRAVYASHFGSVLDSDFQTYMRGSFDDYTIAQRGCDRLNFAPTLDDGGSIEIRAVMDCSSLQVVNLYHDPDAGVIEWGFDVSPEQAGAFTISWSPEGEYLSLEHCHPPTVNWRESLRQMGDYTLSWSKASDTTTVILAAGQYKLRWPAKFGSTIEFSLRPPCTFEAGNCPNAEQCNIWNECQPEATNPAASGEPCEQDPDGPLVCEAGSRCVGGVCVAECDATQPCAAGQSCSRSRVCGPICNLLAQDCGTGFTCLPSADGTLTSLGSGVCVAAGEGQLLDPCDWRQSDCAYGLSCETGDNVCLQLCDPNAADSGCPEETPICSRLRDGPAGFCRKKLPSE